MADRTELIARLEQLVKWLEADHAPNSAQVCREAIAALRAGAGVSDALANVMLDKFERAAMAYERLGKLTRDDEKTREMRKEVIADLASSRRAIRSALSQPAQSAPRLDHGIKEWSPEFYEKIVRGEHFEAAAKIHAAATAQSQPAQSASRDEVIEECPRCVDWQQMGLSNRCPACDARALKSGARP